ncbi:MAG: pyridoxamine 5'-phosphate oxidase family protein [Myxococcales bacterium]|nr:pyridoxamine 5'-phosphate oxidase family protein [Myxococcales bacterium]
MPETDPTKLASDIAFTPAVKALQVQRGSRSAYARMEAGGGWARGISDELRAFIGEQTSVFLGTANAEGQPYIQHRGGPRGFLRVLDEHTLAFADFRGNRQFISLGNLSENPKIHLFLIDYAQQRRIKLWGRAKVVDDDPQLLADLMPAGYAAKPEQAIVIEVHAWDVNCPQHIPQRLEAADVAEALAERDRRISELEERLRQAESER